VYLGLKEVYETSDSGHKWTSIGPYWNFGKACWSFDPNQNTCPNTTHPDQHAAFVAADGTAYFGNDGGMYSRPASLRKVVRWNDLNATLRTLQYYYAGIGQWPGGGDAVWGGLQDNGTSLLKPAASQLCRRSAATAAMSSSTQTMAVGQSMSTSTSRWAGRRTAVCRTARHVHTRRLHPRVPRPSPSSSTRNPATRTRGSSRLTRPTRTTSTGRHRCRRLPRQRRVTRVVVAGGQRSAERLDERPRGRTERSVRDLRDARSRDLEVHWLNADRTAGRRSPMWSRRLAVG
jgi:hypothetical protein